MCCLRLHGGEADTLLIQCTKMRLHARAALEVFTDNCTSVIWGAYGRLQIGPSLIYQFAT